MPYLSESPLIFWARQYTGWITLRNQLTTPIRLLGRRVIELYDALLAGNDLEITQRLTLARRPGYLSYFSGAMNGTLLNTYTWRSASLGVFQIFDTTVDIEYIAPGVSSPNIIFTKPTQSIGNKSFFFGVGNYLFVSGVGFSFKWDGPNSAAPRETNWGIANSTQTFGPNTAGTGTQLGIGNAWTNPGDVTGSVGFAFGFTSSGIPGVPTDQLQAEVFGFNILPLGMPISGIQVSWTGFGNGVVTTTLLKGTTPTGTAKKVNQPASAAPITVGGPSDLWGTTFTAFDINQTGFGVQFQVFGGGLPKTANIQNVQITVFTGGGPTVTVLPGAGSVSAVNGWSYVTAYGNATSGEISNASPPSLNTGPFTNKAGVQISLIASTDFQVNQIHVYRTTDSGGGSIFYELPTSPYPNTTGNVTDTALDTDLQVDNIAATALQNTPPPNDMTTMEWFAGRMWGVVNNLLYFSTGPDSVSGLEPSNWNPAYVFVLPTNISRLVGTPNGMLVHCVDECHIVRGTATVNFTVNLFERDLAVLNYNAVDTDGSNIYAFTSDRQLLQLGGNGTVDIGQVIGDQLLNVDPSQAYLTQYRFGLDSMLFLLDTVNGILYPYNLNQQCWCLPGIMQFATSPSAAGAVEVSAGVWKYIMGSGTALGQRDLGTFSDLGNPYTPNAVIGTIQLADPLTLAKVENIILQFTNTGTVPGLQVLVNDAGVTLTNPVGSQITGTFTNMSVGNNPIVESPTYAAQASNFRNLRYRWGLTPLPAQCQFIQMLLQFDNGTTQNELIGVGIAGKQPGDSPNAGQLPQLMGH